MNITVLDGYTLNPGDISWEPLERLGRLTVYDRTAPDQVVERSLDADILLTNKTVIGEEEIRLLPRLKYIGVLATGYNVVDVAAAKEAGITVTNIPAYSTDSVAQQIFALSSPSPIMRSIIPSRTVWDAGRVARISPTPIFR